MDSNNKIYSIVIYSGLAIVLLLCYIFQVFILSDHSLGTILSPIYFIFGGIVLLPFYIFKGKFPKLMLHTFFYFFLFAGASMILLTILQQLKFPENNIGLPPTFAGAGLVFYLLYYKVKLLN